MEHTEDDRTVGDALGEVIRAAGHRPPPPQAHYDSVLAASRDAWQRSVHARRRRRNWYALAASLVAVGAVTAILQIMQPDPSETIAELVVVRGQVEWRTPAAGTWTTLSAAGEGLPLGANLRTGADGSAALGLPNGGALRIDAGTELVIEREAVALVRGTVYFDTEDRPSETPVTVETAYGVVQDVGTQFEVYSSSEALRVRVREGEVRILESGLSAELAAEAGQELELSAAGQLRRRAIATDAEIWSWVESLAVPPSFERHSVLLYLEWVARETGKQLRFDSRSTALSAEFVSWNGDASGMTPLEVLQSIAATSDFSYEMTEDGAIVIRRRVGP